MPPLPADRLTQDFLPESAKQQLLTRVRTTIVLDLFALFKSQVLPQIGSELAVAWLAWGHADRFQIIAWLLVCFLIHAPLEVWGFLHTRRYGIPEHQIERWRSFLQTLSVTNALLVCYAYYAFGIGSTHEELFLLFPIGVMLVTAQFSRSDFKSACVGVIPICIGVVSIHLMRGSERDLMIAAFTAIAAGAAVFMVFQQSKQMFEMIYTRFLNEALADVLRTKNAEAIQAKEDAESANRTKTRFFVSASHDLRQPLHALLLLMGSLRLKVSDASVQPTLRLMETALGSLKSLFDDLLDIARLESGKTSATIDTVPVLTLFETLAHEFEPLAAAKGLQLHFRAPDVAIVTDGLLLQRILRNLVSNAIKYTTRGGVLIACRRRGKQSAVIQVFDTGIGIAPDHLDAIFDDFYQVPASPELPRASREGVGLGLAIVKRLAGLLDHSISVRSRTNRGSAFTVHVPLSSERVITVASRGDETPSLSLSGRSIWVVDDDPSVAEAMKILLSSWNANVVVITSKSELFDASSGRQRAPDFVIADFQFEPSYSGEQIIRFVRERFDGHVPCAIMTGNVALVPERLARVERIPVLAKPVTPIELRSLLTLGLSSPAPVNNAYGNSGLPISEASKG